ncbi:MULTISPECIES: NAD(P)/FAD-dependent oxidoreductase [Alphaproteobacteria]|uniref:FAD-dependent oxidoreductase n=2 Tax=Alphaproteobacteria TaxID=28211 RepID=A0A512HJL6_9HYPH|nr:MULTISPECIES: FAD-binding oxidoreductase [Alphaproteobacteria]GEO85647.1 FAD-dependent oxidoreductase [Ciceribacter naphthalenivorans]GLR21998.1 FAD-dependent oxidoreductase [Ciceribacter naphthalenivorans]GLT04854.1 FAD-dependent oxidoreductase [Sphingomonas psychrolutea]
MNPSHFSKPVWRLPDRSAFSDLPITGPERVDLAVVGGGFQGLSTAYAAALRGLSVRVMEARGLGEGASGLNGGQVIPGLKFDPERLLEIFGDRQGEVLIDFAAGAADTVFKLIDTEGLDVEHVRSGWIQAAHTDAAMAAITQRSRQWQVRGADAMLLNGAEIALLTGATGYLGGWLDRRAGTINPLAFVFGLARLATEAGAQIATGVGATGLRREGGEWRVETSAGHPVMARSVLVATNAYSDALVPGLARSLVPLHSFQIATAPLPPDLQETVLPHGQAVSDSRRILVYYRKSADGRLVLGGRGRMGEPRSEKDWQHLQVAMLRLFPQLEGVAIEHRWFGRVAMTTDHLPHLHEPEKGLVVAAGCQGRGIALMAALGPRLADYFESGDPSALPFPLSPIRTIPLHALRQIGVGAMVAWYRMLDSLEG